VEHDAARAPEQAVSSTQAASTAGPAVPLLAALDPAARIGPTARAAALRPLQAAGNRALARAVLARRAVATPTGTIYAYDRSEFGQRFDAEVDSRGTITIVCRVKFDVDKDMFHAEGYSDADMERERREFAAGFPAAINAAWSYKRALKADWRPQMNCVARAVPVESGEHARITLAYPKTGFRSYIDPRTESQTGPTTGRFEMDDLKSEKAVWMSNTPQQFEFQHVVAAHEFGHLIGIQHIDKPGHTGDAEYGDTWEEASDIMGWGMTVTAHDMKPWIEAAKAYGKEMGMPGGGTWTVVDPA
jgi:hypothetical protein